MLAVLKTLKPIPAGSVAKKEPAAVDLRQNTTSWMPSLFPARFTQVFHEFPLQQPVLCFICCEVFISFIPTISNGILQLTPNHLIPHIDWEEADDSGHGTSTAGSVACSSEYGAAVRYKQSPHSNPKSSSYIAYSCCQSVPAQQVDDGEDDSALGSDDT